MSADEQQAADMAAIRRRWPRKVWATLDECGGDPNVRVERVSHHGVAQWKATLKSDPDGMSGYGSAPFDAVRDLYSMLSLWNDMLRERAGDRFDAPATRSFG